MKVGNNSGFQGSFGIPQHLKDAMEETKKSKEEKRPGMESEEPGQPDLEYDEGLGGAEEALSSAEAVEEKIPNPLEALRDNFSITLEDEDFHKIIFKGFLEKEVVVLPSIRGTKPMKATFKTLTGEEYDVVDELLAEEIRDTRMTNDGYSTRRSMWILAVGITQIQGKPVSNPVFKETEKGRELDLKASARAKRIVISKLNAAILTRYTRIHAQLTIAINAIIEDPEADYLKKP